MPDDTASQPPSGAPPQRTTGGNMRWTPPSPEHMARMLPQYDQWETLGHGGMGAVYKARQVNLDRTVAVKILPPEAADDEAQFIERFKNEARTMAKLDHPAIVAVHDFGETAEGQLYFVMAYVDGTDVSKMIAEQGALPAEHALAITAHVCDALQYAHEHGVIHRDIKPANVLINRDGVVKMADFGLAKMDDPANSVGLTKSGMSMGTPDFVAPESLTLGMVADHRADLYAVGVMLYQMLTGKIPRGHFDLPSQLVSGLDARHDNLVLRAMKEDREQRFQSALDIRHALDEVLRVPRIEPVEEPDAFPEEPPAPSGVEDETVTPSAPPGKRRKPKPILAMSTLATTAIVIFIGASALTKNPDKTGQPLVVAQANTTPKSGPGSGAATLPPDVLKKLADLRGTYDQFVDANILKPHDAAVAALEAHDHQALERARDDATKKGDLDTVVAAKAEIERLSKKAPLPASDDALPVAFKPLRTTFRAELAKLEQARDAKIPDANKRYDTALDAYQVQLTQSQQVDAALHVKALRAELAASKGIMAAASAGSAVGGPADADKLKQVEESLVDSTWAVEDGIKLYFAKNGKGAYRGTKVVGSFQDRPKGGGWSLSPDGTISVRMPGMTWRLVFNDAENGMATNISDGGKELGIERIANDPEMVKAAGVFPATSADAPQADGSTPPVSVARMKEIEGWLVGSTWEAAGISYYFANNGKGAKKEPSSGIKPFSRWGDGWKLHPDGTVSLPTMGRQNIFTLTSAERGSLMVYAEKKPAPEKQQLKKVENDPELVKAVK